MPGVKVLNIVGAVFGVVLAFFLFPSSGFCDQLKALDAKELLVYLFAVGVPIAIAIWWFMRSNKAKLEKLNETGEVNDFISLFRRR